MIQIRHTIPLQYPLIQERYAGYMIRATNFVEAACSMAGRVHDYAEQLSFGPEARAVTADRAYVREFVLARNRELGKNYSVACGEAFPYARPAAAVGETDSRVDSRVEQYIRQHAVPAK